ncbi:MAG: amidohydrolase [Lachnospiraceae bacterium]|jgi:amidohydrolase|nr:amidohydrolase [Lachnospiraceae bacterium]NBJ80647.1 amidohydrolase [bacterium 1XD42-76]NBK03856.1 amidohydrolase [bacterium 1XD42-94]
MDHIEQKILSIIDEHAEELKKLASQIYHNPERGFAEHETAKAAADFLRKYGMEPREGLALTGVKADINQSDGPSVALIGELDGIGCPAHPDAAPTGISHACGHEAQMIAIMGAALALNDPEIKAALGGRAVFFGVPAEENLSADIKAELAKEGIVFNGGKSELIRRGEFDDVDISITSHVHMVSNCSSDLLLGNVASTGFVSKSVHMKGKAAHAAAAPHDGVNALNAATLGFNAMAMIRETFQEKDAIRVHGQIRDDGFPCQTIPDHVHVDLMVRAKTLEAINQTSAKVDRAYRGAASAIGADCDIVTTQGYLPVIMRKADQALVEAAEVLKEQRPETTIENITDDMINFASTDAGDLTHIMPVLNFTFGGAEGALHSKDYRITDEYKLHIMPAKMMAITAYRLLKDGAAEAKAILDGFHPTMTKDEYLAYAKALH